MNLLIGAVTIGLILAPLALGLFVSYRVYNTLDLTADGSFGLGAAVVAALLVQDAPPPLHDFARGLHLCFELRIMRGNAIAVWGFGHVYRVALFELQPSEDFLR